MKYFLLKETGWHLVDVLERIDHPCEEMPDHRCPMCEAFEKTIDLAKENTVRFAPNTVVEIFDEFGEKLSIDELVKNKLYPVPDGVETEIGYQWDTSATVGKSPEWQNVVKEVYDDWIKMSPTKGRKVARLKAVEKKEDDKIKNVVSGDPYGALRNAVGKAKEKTWPFVFDDIEKQSMRYWSPEMKKEAIEYLQSLDAPVPVDRESQESLFDELERFIDWQYQEFDFEKASKEFTISRKP